jgi:peptidoglycan hydrolase FlgJ
MTVAPVSDLIVDVMAAADPGSQRVAASKLERLAADQNFAATVDEKIEAGGLQQSGASAAAGVVPRSDALDDGAGHATIVKTANRDNAVYRKFEAFILQMFVESMLPKDASDVFGKGTAGTIWRSMLAEQIGNEMAGATGSELPSSWRRRAIRRMPRVTRISRFASSHNEVSHGTE